jgi:glucuronate isomerase
MSHFIHDDFLLSNKPARKLYHEYAAEEPILDYHNHLPPEDVAGDRRFNNLFEIWLEGDHYKWRGMRCNGVAEEYCTGNASPREKFQAWATTVPHTLRNPLYHWTHLELKRYFDIDELLNEDSADRIWEQANEQLQDSSMSTQGILKKFKVKGLCTTDDPVDPLPHHQAHAANDPYTRMYPTFRPDKSFTVDQPDVFNPWVDKLGVTSNTDIGSYADLLASLKKRHDDFHALGARISDHGLSHCYADFISDAEASAIFDKVRAGAAATETEQHQFAANLMLLFGQLDAEKGWTKQLHLGARRNNNTRKFKEIGPDTGFDSIGDWPQTDALGRYLDRLDQENALPKIVLYNLNPNWNYSFGTMLGNFMDGVTPGKIQLGSGWWFLDQREAMEWQINALSNLGLLSRFIGMLTDSRSFMSFSRHEYFRRTLCDLLGRDIKNGELPKDYELVGSMVKNICYQNAADFTGLAL